jgi:Flp pilus assembly protein TadD
VARTVLLAADAVADPETAVKLGLSQQQPDAVELRALGGLLLRAGKSDEAVTRLRQAAADARPGAAPVAELLLALALHKQGKTDEARRALERARFVLEREAPVRQAAGLWGAVPACPWQAAAALASSRPEPPRRDWITRLELRLLRQEVEAALQAR